MDADPYALTCPCSCHGGGLDARCDADGGCAHLHTRRSNAQDAVRALTGEPAGVNEHKAAGADSDTIYVEQPYRAPAAEIAALHDRRCARAEQCTNRSIATASDGTEHRVGRLLDTATGLCFPCTNTVATALRELPRDYLRLYAELAPGSSGENDKVSGSREAPVPTRIANRDLAQRIATVAEIWAGAVADAAGTRFDTRQLVGAPAHQPAVIRTVRPHRVLAAAVRLLHLHLARLLALPEQHVVTWAPDGQEHAFCRQSGLDAALELHHLHHLTELTLGLGDLQHRLPAPCPQCERMTLVRDNGSSTVRCTRGCVSWSESDYQRLTLVLANDVDFDAA